VTCSRCCCAPSTTSWRLLRDSAAEIGEIVGGDLGREVGRIGASFLLGLMSETLLGDAGSQAATDQFGQVT
jgi:hypothetical protein